MPRILAIESSCDDTSAAVCVDGTILSNSISSQIIHQQYGGVVPELASRAHEVNIARVVNDALIQSKIAKESIDAVAFTRGPGLVGSLLVGLCFAKSFALTRNLPLIEVNHIQAHVLSALIEHPSVSFPFLCFTISGGHTQLVYVENYLSMTIIGTTIDDAAGECFDKAAKMLGLNYPGGPIIDKLAQGANPLKFSFAKPNIPDLNFSFSGVKTSILYFLQKAKQQNEHVVSENLQDLCASIQHTIIDILMSKLLLAHKKYPTQNIVLAGGVAANSYFRSKILDFGKEKKITISIPSLQYCTDNAAMIALVAHYKYLDGQFSNQEVEPLTKNYSL